MLICSIKAKGIRALRNIGAIREYQRVYNDQNVLITCVISAQTLQGQHVLKETGMPTLLAILNLFAAAVGS